MARHRLDNARWGFESNCFVCEASNDAGLRIPFFHDTDSDRVVADVELDQRFSGAPNYLHGGIALAVLDEAMAWATIAIAGRFAVTTTTAARFHRPLRVGVRYHVSASVTTCDERELHCDAVIADDRGRAQVTASAVFTPLGPARAADAIGQPVDGDTAAYVGERSPEDGDRGQGR